MPQIVSTGQITIVDQNDAKPILAIISASGALQQLYSKDNGSEVFTPNRVSTPLTLTSNIFVGGTDVSAGTSISGRAWSTSFNGASLGSGVTFSVNTNLNPVTEPSRTYYFTCTYTDPVTSIASRVDAQITLTINSLGSNAVYVQVSGRTTIVQSDTATKNVAVIKANLVRASGYDGDNLQYRWSSIASNGTSSIIYNAAPGIANYGIKTTAVASEPSGSSADLGAATWTTAGVSSNVAGNAASWSTSGTPGFNTLVVGEAAVNSFQLFKVEVRDSTDTSLVYSEYFTITDVSDPYQVVVTSTAGDRFLQGVGSSSLQAEVYGGSTKVADLSGWTFDWYIRNKNGERVGFVQYSSGATPAIQRTITANTTTGLTLSSAPGSTIPAGTLVKLVSADGAVVKFAQIASTSTTAVALQSASGDNLALSTVSSLIASEFVNGTFYTAVAKKTTTGTNALTVTQHDVDGKAAFTVDANRP